MRRFGHFFFRSLALAGSTSATATSRAFLWLVISVRSDRAMPPAPRLACSTRSEGGALSNLGMKKGAAMDVTAADLRNERLESCGDDFMGKWSSTSRLDSAKRNSLGLLCFLELGLVMRPHPR